MKNLILICSLFFITNINAASTAFIKITGTKQGIFKGESVAKGHENTTQITSYTFEENSPRDPQTGLPTGRRLIRPITVVKDWGASSPMIYQALATNEVLKEVKIDFFTINPQVGMEFNERTIILTDATISNVKDVTATVNGDLVDAEAITFTFQRIRMTDNKSGTIFEDSNTP